MCGSSRTGTKQRRPYMYRSSEYNIEYSLSDVEITGYLRYTITFTLFLNGVKRTLPNRHFPPPSFRPPSIPIPF